ARHEAIISGAPGSSRGAAAAARLQSSFSLGCNGAPGTKEQLNMRMMLTATLPHEPFNSLVREGKVGTIIGRILDELKPEAVYFMEQNGRRCAVLIINFTDV